MKNFFLSKFGGVNKADPQSDLKDFEASDLLNVRLSRESLFRRNGTNPVGNIGDGEVSKLQEYKRDLFAYQDGILKKLSGISWINVLSGLSKKPLLISSEITGNLFSSGTVSEEDTYKTSITLSNSFSDNALFGKYLVINGEVRKIVANTGNISVVADSFLKSLTGASYSIFNPVNGSLLFNGDQPKKSSDLVSFQELPNIPYFKYACSYQNRIVGVYENSSTIYFSTILNGEDFPYTLDVNANDGDFITGIKTFGNQLVIFKNYSIWITEFENPTEATLVQRADNFGCINGETIGISENILFFLSHRGLEWFNTLETNALEGHKALSDFCLPQIKDENPNFATGIGFNGKFYLSFSDTKRTYIFDTSLYLQTGVKTFLIDGGYKANSFAVANGELYFGGNGNVFNFSGDTDNGISFPSFWTTKKISLKDKKRQKVLRMIGVGIEGNTGTESLEITDKTEREEKNLGVKNLDSKQISFSGKRTKGVDHKITFNLENLGNAHIESAESLFELGKI